MEDDEGEEEGTANEDGDGDTAPVAVPGDDVAPADPAATAAARGHVASTAAADAAGDAGRAGDEGDAMQTEGGDDDGAAPVDGGAAAAGGAAVSAADATGTRHRAGRAGDDTASAPPPPPDGANPHRSLAAALDHWRAAHARGDAPADAAGDEAAASGDDAEFMVGDGVDDGDEGGAAALGAATDDQARGGVAHADEEKPRGDDAAPAPPDAGPTADAPAGGVGDANRAGKGGEGAEEEGAEEEEEGGAADAPPPHDARASCGADAIILGASTFPTIPPPAPGPDGDAERARLEAGLAAALAAPRDAQAATTWPAVAALTERTAAELAAALTAALEPTRASRLARGYKTGKRVDMRAVVAYVASGFRRDAIWMRRTRPDARDYRVVLVIDDSRSVAEAGVAPFAVEAVASVGRALARAELGDLAVVAAGGAAGPSLLHPFGAPLDDAALAATVGGLTFAADATVGETPAADALRAVGTLLDSGRCGSGGGALASALTQLVVVIGDGRFHEKAPLRAEAAALAARPGVLLAYVALDGGGGGGGGGGSGGSHPSQSQPSSSLADLRTISFGPDGAPRATPYLDDFPFPHYVLLRRAAGLPSALGGLLRAWLGAAAAAGGA